MPVIALTSPQTSNPGLVNGQLVVTTNAGQDFTTVQINTIAAQVNPALAVTNSAGVNTFTVSQAGAVSAAGGIAGPAPVSSALVGATVALTAAQSGTTFLNRSTSGAPSWTLPTLAAGLSYTFVCANTTAGFTVTGPQVIHAKTSATGTAITTTTTLTNTQATAVVGDAITIVADATSNAWWMTSQTGIFAAS